MKLEDGLYVLPSGRSSAAVSVVCGIPAVESLAGGLEGVRLRLEVLYPDKDFSKAKVLEKAAPGAEGRARFAKSLVKTLFSLPWDAMAESLDGFLNAWAATGDSFEASFVMTVMTDPTSYVDSWKHIRLYEGANRIGDAVSRTAMGLPGWARWREAHKANLASNSEDTALLRKWIADPESVEGWAWTKEDAEEAASIMKANPAYQ